MPDDEMLERERPGAACEPEALLLCGLPLFGIIDLISVAANLLSGLVNGCVLIDSANWSALGPVGR